MTEFFSPDYLTARTRFRSGVLANNAQVESILLNSKGPGGEDLTIDIGWFGSPQPARVLVHSSGLHGVEGFAGSAIQAQWLEKGIRAIAPGHAIAIVHAMNPFGMAWLRRVNENNVDLDRNFLAADQKYDGAPDRYAAMDSFLNPPSPPAMDFFMLCAFVYPALRRAVAEGQYQFPLGLSYGGSQHEQEARRFQLYISGKLNQAEQIVGIDVHTGPCCNAGAESKGALGGLYRRMFPGARVLFEKQQFGTGNPWATLAALRRENRQHYHGDGDLRNPAKAKMMETFCPAQKTWRDHVLTQGTAAITHGLARAFD